MNTTTTAREIAAEAHINTSAATVRSSDPDGTEWLTCGDARIALAQDEADDEGRTIYTWCEYAREDGEWIPDSGQAGTEAEAREALTRWTTALEA